MGGLSGGGMNRCSYFLKFSGGSMLPGRKMCNLKQETQNDN